MRSTDMEENGRGFSTAKGESPGTVGWVFTLAAWQLAHPAMNLWRKVLRGLRNQGFLAAHTQV